MDIRDLMKVAMADILVENPEGEVIVVIRNGVDYTINGENIFDYWFLSAEIESIRIKTDCLYARLAKQKPRKSYSYTQQEEVEALVGNMTPPQALDVSEVFA